MISGLNAEAQVTPTVAIDTCKPMQKPHAGDALGSACTAVHRGKAGGAPEGGQHRRSRSGDHR